MTNDLVRKTVTVLLRIALVLGCTNAVAQSQSSFEFGMGVSPAYEGWVANPDGSFTMLFGYMNENWKEELDVPIGPNNSFSPGAADRGQPTHFQPRRNRNVFGIVVPADFEGELEWTLVTRDGVTQKAYGSLLKDYVLERITIMSESGTVAGGFNNSEDVQTNQPPVVTLQGDEARTVRVGEPLQLEVAIEDDDKPNPRTGFRLAAFSEEDSPRERLERALRPPIRGTVDRVVGMTYSWTVYRGTGKVIFDPLQVKTWEDTRAFQNSPWSPYWDPPAMSEDGKVETEVSFQEPGYYQLRGFADDGGLMGRVDVTVRVVE
ncbi:MAG TPA: hypothetical protein DCM64_12395 [Gammaproteobacteria bacterium]|jgi:hypothetical protein|nr:hypothetical protein [Gammaproteobacteria bacterium]MDP6731544.1 hypothetical protein [Gammaproteobacteria bacterium]HAJ77240.1 hypothetical protein [Gammaproteobacteria bacterium]|tara:strand:- start:2026 stop:2982 length:957 start_codon:yes stop_codon:yes gene_type:complete